MKIEISPQIYVRNTCIFKDSKKFGKNRLFQQEFGDPDSGIFWNLESGSAYFWYFTFSIMTSFLQIPIDIHVGNTDSWQPFNPH